MEPVYTLELCSGTGSFSKVMQSWGYEVVTVDINPQFTPTHAHDILTFPYKNYTLTRTIKNTCGPVHRVHSTRTLNVAVHVI